MSVRARTVSLAKDVGPQVSKFSLPIFTSSMCGIAGIIGPVEDVTEERLGALRAAVAHRGPDGSGVEIIPSSTAGVAVGLVHTRLAIIDPSAAGAQPMHDAASERWLTFNGEIYNYRELRKELEAAGHRFRTRTDTEVVLTAYAEWGSACVERFAGMFAFALWDARTQSIFCAVDRFGIKPLYLWRGKNGTIAFASEVRALLSSELIPRRIDHEAVASYLAFGSIQAPRTIIHDVVQLLPAHTMHYDVRTGEWTSRSYWSPPVVSTMQDASDEEIEQALHHAVTRHLVSDVPIGLFLSGGVDSSALAVLAHRLGYGDALTSFTVTFPESQYAEGPYARSVGERFCARHVELEIADSDLTSMLPNVLAAADQPSIDGVNVYAIAQAVHAEGLKTVLSGQGGDEVFGGYSTFQRIPHMLTGQKVLGMVPMAVRSHLAAKTIATTPAHPLRAKMASYLTSQPDVVGQYAIVRQLFHDRVVRQVLPKQRSVDVTPKETAEMMRAEVQGRDSMSTVTMLELRGYLANTLLRDCDVMSMAHGLEVRVPFLDHNLVETVLRVPERRKRDAVLSKPLLLRHVIDALPREVYARKKMGFTFPWEQWLRGPLRPQIEETLHSFPRENALGLDVVVSRNLWETYWDHRGGVTWSRPWALHVLMQWAIRNRCV
jgi:asparagine synthase (glutamine-hydrolysing)